MYQLLPYHTTCWVWTIPDRSIDWEEDTDLPVKPMTPEEIEKFFLSLEMEKLQPADGFDSF